MFTNLIRCRACKSTNLIPVFDLGVQPLANDFTLPDEEQAGYAPLKVLFCSDCTLAQLSVVVDPKILYRQYRYTTSRSQTMARHFDSLCNDILQEAGKGSVIEIGSNDGHFLKALHSHGFGPVMGIDPAQNLCEQATAESFSVICAEWGAIAALTSRKLMTLVDIIVARHVFCHVDNWRHFIESLDIVTHDETLVCIEVPYVKDMLERGEFDTIYHEHLSYFTVRAMARLLIGTNWRIHRINRYPVHGGSIVVMLRHLKSKAITHQSAFDFLNEENSETVGLEAWYLFSKQVNFQLKRLEELMLVRASGSIVSIFGASAKSTVLIHAANLKSHVKFISDTTPEKIGRCSPGTSIPIISEQAFLERQPDYAILSAWNYKDEILEKMKPYLDRGGKFIIPGPDLEVIQKP